MLKKYRQCVGIVLFNNEKKIFVGKRLDSFNLSNHNLWQMPQGGIDCYESPQQALFREMEEEIGTSKGKIVAQTKNLLRYDFPKNVKHNVWKGQFSGQEQRWFLVQFLGLNSDIKLNKHTQEFSEWKWENINFVMQSVIDFKKNVYQKVFEEFKNFLE